MSAARAGLLRARLWEALGPRGEAVRTLVRIAVRQRTPPFLVGGPVRDLLARRRVVDVDILLPDGLETLARAGASTLGGRLVLHARFLTATIETPDLRIDLSRARSERYPRPGALPVVRPATVDEDLGRRDFSVNAIALPLHAAAGAELVDPHGGCADLRRRVLRALHAESFRDDPTRAFRGLRYASRFGLRVESRTSRWLREALASGAVDSLSGDRIRHEIERLLDEPDPGRTARAMGRWGVFGATVPQWSPRPDVYAVLRRLVAARRRPPWPEAAGPGVYRGAGMRALLLGARGRVQAAVVERLSIQGRPARELVEDLKRVTRARGALRGSLRRGSVDAQLEGLSEAALLLLYCIVGARAKRAVSRYARVDRRIGPPFDGHAARDLGARGPQVGALLRAARRRRLEGRTVDTAWARRWLARHR